MTWEALLARAATMSKDELRQPVWLAVGELWDRTVELRFGHGQGVELLAPACPACGGPRMFDGPPGFIKPCDCKSSGA